MSGSKDWAVIETKSEKSFFTVRSSRKRFSLFSVLRNAEKRDLSKNSVELIPYRIESFSEMLAEADSRFLRVGFMDC